MSELCHGNRQPLVHICCDARSFRRRIEPVFSLLPGRHAEWRHYGHSKPFDADPRDRAPGSARPHGPVSGGRLAAAVSQAGGLGLLGGGYGDGDWIDREWNRAGNARIGCGFITWSLAKHPQVLDRALQPAAIMLSFGDPRPFSPAIHAAGARLICQVQTIAQAREATEAGADVVVAQGTEAGGHGMSEPLFTLLPQVVDVTTNSSRKYPM